MKKALLERTLRIFSAGSYPESIPDYDYDYDYVYGYDYEAVIGV